MQTGGYSEVATIHKKLIQFKNYARKIDKAHLDITNLFCVVQHHGPTDY